MTVTTTPHPPATLLSADMLRRFDERAPRYDRENRFFAEDFDELRASGYLDRPVPTELGGHGLDLTPSTGCSAAWRTSRRRLRWR